jgi:hypothetical protein
MPMPSPPIDTPCRRQGKSPVAEKSLWPAIFRAVVNSHSSIRQPLARVEAGMRFHMLRIFGDLNVAAAALNLALHDAAVAARTYG